MTLRLKFKNLFISFRMFSLKICFTLNDKVLLYNSTVISTYRRIVDLLNNYQKINQRLAIKINNSESYGFVNVFHVPSWFLHACYQFLSFFFSSNLKVHTTIDILYQPIRRKLIQFLVWAVYDSPFKYIRASYRISY